MEMPLVLVVTPTLNAGCFIAETIESVRSQSYANVLHVVVDGGSSDATVEIVKRYQNVRLIESKGSNQSRAINIGLKLVPAEYFAFLNADDLLLQDALQTGVSLLEESRDAAVAYGGGQFIDKHGRIIGRYSVGEGSLEAFSKECTICQPATLMRYDDLVSLGGLDERLHFSLDYDLWIRFLKAGKKFVRTPEVLALSRMHASTKTLGSRKAVYEETFCVLRKHFGYVPFNWIHAYAGYLLDEKDQFFEVSEGSPRRTALTLYLGIRENSQNPLKFVREFTREMRRFHIGNP